MSNYNACEKTCLQEDRFFEEVVESASALRIAKILRTERPCKLTRTPTIVDMISRHIPFQDPTSEGGILTEQANICAAAILAGECSQFSGITDGKLIEINRGEA